MWVWAAVNIKLRDDDEDDDDDDDDEDAANSTYICQALTSIGKINCLLSKY